MCSDARTSEYIAKRVSEGKRKREAARCLKRYVARETYRALMPPAPPFRKEEAAGLLQRDVAARPGSRPSVISSIETERAKHVTERDAHEAFLNGLEKRNNAD